MKYKVQPIDDYAVVVSDDYLGINIPFWGYCWNWRDKLQHFKNGLNKDASGRDGIKKVIATIDKDLTAEGIPMLVLTNQVEDVERLAKLKFPKWENVDKHDWMNLLDGFNEGYKAAQQDKKWRDADVLNIVWNFIGQETPQKHEADRFNKKVNDYLQSLQKKAYPEYVDLDLIHF